MSDRIPYAYHSVGKEEADAVTEVIMSGWLTTGPRVDAFEKAVSEAVAAKYAVAMSSCTAGLELALTALGIGRNAKTVSKQRRAAGEDEVIVPTLTMFADAIAVIRAGARLVLCDVDPGTLQADVASIEAKVTPNTKAVITVHYGGHTGDMAALDALARVKGFAVIEDAAHAFGARYMDTGQPVGSRQSSAVFSHHPCKNLTTAEGGTVTTQDKDTADTLRALRWFGLVRDEKTKQRTVCLFGAKANMTDIQAAIGLAQLDKFDAMQAKRRELVKRYHEEFARLALDEVTFPAWDYHACAWHLFPVRVPREHRNRVIGSMHHKGIDCAVHYLPIHLHPWARQAHWLQTRAGMFPHAEAAARELISLPLYPGLTYKQQDRVIGAFVQALTDSIRRTGDQGNGETRQRGN